MKIKITKLLNSKRRWCVCLLPLIFLACELPNYSGSKEEPSFTEYEEFSLSSIKASSTEVAERINSSSFLRGFDVSTLYDLERYGASFYNNENKKEDMLKILADNGVNCVRIRIWNDPYNANSTPSLANYGYNTLEKAAIIGARAKSYGLKVWIDFHYSDTWAHPGQQLCPAAWDNYTEIDALAQAVSDYTEKSLAYLKANGAAADFVQIGNEIDSGMFLTSSKNKSAKVTAKLNTEELAKILNSASSAVKKVDKETEVIIHVANPAYYTRITELSGLESDNYDAIGISYYPCDNGREISVLKNSVSGIVGKGKKAYVAETSFPWTCEYVDGKNDDMSNTVYYTNDDSKGSSVAKATSNFSDVIKKYEISTKLHNGAKIINPIYENQARIIKTIIAEVAENGGSGVFYWGGDWVCTTDIPSSWENQTLFDLDGKVLPSIKAFSVKANKSLKK